MTDKLSIDHLFCRDLAMSTVERRRDTRFPVIRPVKLRCVDNGRFLAAKTSNLSATGALLELDGPARVTPGQRLELGIAWNAGQVLLNASTLTTATVIRTQHDDQQQRVALRFDHRQELAVTA